MTRDQLMESLLHLPHPWPRPETDCNLPTDNGHGDLEGWIKGPTNNEWHYAWIGAHERRIVITREQWEEALLARVNAEAQSAWQHGNPNAHESVRIVITECSEAKDTNPKDAIGANKLPLHLWPVPATALGSLALLDGALKYGRTNWRAAGVRASIYVDACQRHLGAWFEGEDTDPDSGIHHLGHALACLAILTDAQHAGKLTDDRMLPGNLRQLIDQLTPEVERLKEKHSDKHPHHYTIEDADQ
ncbi:MULTISPECIES: dATP/dGTP diphosphohydrolase domain-containing protein [Cobetia]|uniref:dATP/dGTP diphosphohydrolase domain-containing protein n=1 Tax=Cobetia TaxID=204286 RepID=UPI001583FFDA|nr:MULTISPECIES: dATP/dGTP diphosphohydrolase domain-containing protein [Cobetia]MDI4659527.1 DUF5664 domain-containing protein [Cobetia sp. BMC6]NUJ56075.1 hypothetical protein [Cobetia marina]